MICMPLLGIQLTLSVVSLLNVITILFSRSTSVGVSGGGGGTIK